MPGRADVEPGVAVRAAAYWIAGVIRLVTPLEDMYVDITSRGDKRAGVLSGNQILPAGQAVSPVQISSVLDSFDSDTRARLSTLLNQPGRRG